MFSGSSHAGGRDSGGLVRGGFLLQHHESIGHVGRQART